MDTNLALNMTQSAGPKYRRLFDALQTAIRSGGLKPGAKLPTVRNLAWDLGITPGTVARAYQMATEAGLIETTVGRGSFVKSAKRALPQIPPNPMAQRSHGDGMNLSNAHTVDLGQGALIREVISEIGHSPELMLADYAGDSALLPCRNLASDWLRGQGVRGRAEDLVVTYGAHNAVMLALTCILEGRDPVIVAPKLCYPGFRQSAQLSRARIVGVESDDEGILPEDLVSICRRERPQVLLCSSNVYNPTCVQTSPERRAQIADIARRFDLHIIEDDIYGTLIEERPDGYDVLCPERVWHATSLSKCLAAGLRVGFLQCPKGQGSLGVRVMQGLSLSLSHVLTKLAATLFENGSVAKYGPMIASENAKRLELALNLLGRFDVSYVRGVNFIWVEIPRGWRASHFLQACQREHIFVAPGDLFTLPGEPAPNAMRVSLAGADSHEALTKGLTRIADLLSHPPRAMLA